MTDLSKPPRPEVILFDWDGTLADSFALPFAAYNHVADHFEMPHFTQEQVILNTRRSSRDIFPELFGERAAEASDVFYAYIREHQLSHLNPKAGAEALLKELSDAGLKMAIVSNMHHGMLVQSVEKLGWDMYFPVVLGAGQAVRDKPAPDPLLLACEKLGANPQHHPIWYIGDTETDMMAARDAGVIPVLIGHGARTISDCERVGIRPYFTKNFTELISTFEK
ncbi:MAG TPA: HAD family hydrolase [Alphaproteobacteria bacterium]|nr:HAD family hydrolase [Alphaproteobacteria bacterium]